MQKTIITTEDNVNLSALWWPAEAVRSVLLLHMMPATKESWTELAEKLAQAGMNVLAIDLRGHGESQGGDYKEFTPDQHQQYILDAEAAMEFLRRHYALGEIFLGGASIGANIAIKYMAKHPQVLKGFALSAGLDYYGVKAIDDIPKLQPTQNIFLAAARDDIRKSGGDCGKMAEELYDAAGGKKEKLIFETGGHGTDMFVSHPELYDKIVEFLG